MRTTIRRHRLLLVSLVLGVSAFAMSYSVLSGYVKTVNVVVAVRDVEAYSRIGGGDVTLKEVPLKAAPKGVLAGLADAVGAYARGRIVAGQVLLEGHIAAGKQEVGLSYDLPAESRGIFLPVPASRAVGGVIRGGERVDVLVASKPSEVYGQPREAFTAQRGLLVAEVVKDTDSGEFLGVIVLASPQECEAIARNLENGSVYLSLVPRTEETALRQSGVWPPR